MSGFSDGERERIRRELRETGRELFSRYGLRKTTIADLTDPVGIAPSTFYRFFDSKEELYVEILEAEGEEVARRILEESFEATDDPREAIERFLRAVVEEIESNPLTRRVVVENELDDLRREVGDEAVEADREASIAFVRPYVEPWVESGAVRGDDADTVAAAIRAVTFLTLHEEDIGRDRYDAVVDLLVESVAIGLTTTGE
ncbi:TetR/AcrR family transcriptional regulator [Halopelagius fulvigenes]|uniref:TetR/AcrR family transcriptional regulator n=1 Tax=Halopelagius fulvigenes TaxID=1198324 RepID=A0ABD5TZB6_9EURY